METYIILPPSFLNNNNIEKIIIKNHQYKANIKKFKTIGNRWLIWNLPNLFIKENNNNNNNQKYLEFQFIIYLHKEIITNNNYNLSHILKLKSQIFNIILPQQFLIILEWEGEIIRITEHFKIPKKIINLKDIWNFFKNKNEQPEVKYEKKKENLIVKIYFEESINIFSEYLFAKNDNIQQYFLFNFIICELLKEDKYQNILRNLLSNLNQKIINFNKIKNISTLHLLIVYNSIFFQTFNKYSKYYEILKDDFLNELFLNGYDVLIFISDKNMVIFIYIFLIVFLEF